MPPNSQLEPRAKCVAVCESSARRARCSKLLLAMIFSDKLELLVQLHSSKREVESGILRIISIGCWHHPAFDGVIVNGDSIGTYRAWIERFHVNNYAVTTDESSIASACEWRRPRRHIFHGHVFKCFINVSFPRKAHAAGNAASLVVSSPINFRAAHRRAFAALHLS